MPTDMTRWPAVLPHVWRALLEMLDEGLITAGVARAVTASGVAIDEIALNEAARSLASLANLSRRLRGSTNRRDLTHCYVLPYDAA